jgi:AraC-like DNA-binding protein
LAQNLAVRPDAAAPAHCGPDVFQHALGEAFFPLRFTSPRSFRGSVREVPVPRLKMTRVAASRHTVVRTPDLAQSTKADFWKLVIQLSGTAEVRQQGRHSVFGPGSATLYDASKPYSLEFEGDDNDSLVLLIDHRASGVSGATLSELTARPITAAHGAGAVALPLICTLAQESGRISPGLDAAVADHVRDLTGIMFADQATRLGLDSGRDATDALFDDICRFIEDHLAEPDLRPARIAAAHFISLRYLHEVFHRHDTAVAAYIRERRLEQVRFNLIEPRFLGWTVAAVASLSGFTDAAHFSRLFSARFGEPAGQYRTRMLRSRIPALNR